MVYFAGHSIASNSTKQHRNESEIDCAKFNALNTIHQRFSPYLYPFIIEYCILVVGIWYMMWANINRCPRKISSTAHGTLSESPVDSGLFKVHFELDFNRNHDCHLQVECRYHHLPYPTATIMTMTSKHTHLSTPTAIRVCVAFLPASLCWLWQ